MIISVPLSSPDLGRSTSGNLIADVIEKSKPGAPVRVYADTKVPWLLLSYHFLAQNIHVWIKERFH